MITLQTFLDYFLFLYFLSPLFLGPIVFSYLFKKGFKIYGFIILGVWTGYLCRFALILISMFLVNIFSEMFNINFNEEVLFDIWSPISQFLSNVSLLLIFPVAVMIVNFLLQKKIGKALITTLVLPVFWIISLESYFMFYPLIDTTHSKEFTLQKFKSIQPGMSRSQVEKLIGKPHPSAGGYFDGADGCESQTGDNGPIAKSLFLDFAWLDSAVCYDENDRVTEIKMGYVPD